MADDTGLLVDAGKGALGGAAAGSILGPWGALAGAAIGGILGAVGAGMTSGANAQKDLYLAGVARINAAIDRQNAGFALQSGDIAGEMEGLRSAQEIADTKAKAGASGFIVGSGSNAEVTADQTRAVAFDESIIAWKTNLTAYGDNTKAAMADSQAKMYEAAATNDTDAGYISAASSLIGGASSVADKWTQGSRLGMFGSGGSAIDSSGNPTG